MRGAGCLAQIAPHMIISTHSPSKQPLFPHELLFQLSAPRAVRMVARGLSCCRPARVTSRVGAVWPLQSSEEEFLIGFGYNFPFG